MDYSVEDVKAAVMDEYKSLGFIGATRGRMYMVELTTKLVMDATSEYDFAFTDRFKLKELVTQIPCTAKYKYNTIYHQLQETTDHVTRHPTKKMLKKYQEYFNTVFTETEENGVLTAYYLSPKKVMNRVAYHVYCKLRRIVP